MKQVRKQLLKELRRIQYKTNTGKWVFGVDETYLNALEYFVVLKNGTSFYIQPGSYIIPEFRFKDVLYIRKTLSSSYGRKHMNTTLGYFNFTTKELHSYEKDIIKKYNAVKLVRTHSEEW
ncbi:MAG: hypothetical protein J6V44_05955 [Methanobrevibacter sp.]|nr:hypothetical protein [Methanobrevibacter sp.]MBO7692795.1 hypothetical protein [Methanobrevibacter sp.]